MKLQDYLKKKQNTSGAIAREYCHACHRPNSVCLCDLIQSFDTQTRFLILMHPREAHKEKTGTGRLCKLLLQNSRLFVGVDFTDDPRVNTLLNDPEYKSVLLFPTTEAVNLSQHGYRSMIGRREKLQIVVVDGTWSLAGKILRLSKNLKSLPAISFDARRPSNFRIKKQPRTECLSTLESIHLLLELGQEQGIESPDSNIDQLQEVFDRLVDIQIECANLGRVPSDTG